MENIKFSIIVPTYNRTELLKNTLMSIKNQQYENYEVLVCSDGYNNEDEKLVESLQDERFQYHWIENTGKQFGYRQRNEMIKFATGSYTIYLDDDNYIYPDYLSHAVNNINFNTGILINKIRHEFGILPKTNKIVLREIDTLNFIVKTNVAKLVEWTEIYQHDFYFIKNCEGICAVIPLEIVYTDKIIGIHGYNKEFIDSLNIESDKKIENNEDISICVSTTAKNENYRLPFFLDYYLNYLKVNKIVIYDSNSTDNTHEIVKSFQNEYPGKIELIIRDLAVWDERDTMQVKNEYWKDYRIDGDYEWYDWQICCDIDEFLYHPNIRDLLLEYKKSGVTLPKTNGYDMISLEQPIFEKGIYLHEIVKNGIYAPEDYSKYLIFNPKEVDINYSFGSDHCNPTGNVVLSEDAKFYMLHYKKLSYKYLVERAKHDYALLSEYCKKNNHNYHIKEYSEMSEEEFIEMYNKSEIIF